ncbi:unnamed protein product [Arabis nemorensis]|uniref:Uncharacterized protein n=1 Tax=Arabis nemorensis TaxID=586526 RepID=A0A565BBV9_9BRAS|nr:unnamed protein product [Arabis nemorensis]
MEETLQTLHPVNSPTTKDRFNHRQSTSDLSSEVTIPDLPLEKVKKLAALRLGAKILSGKQYKMMSKTTTPKKRNAKPTSKDIAKSFARSAAKKKIPDNPLHGASTKRRLSARRTPRSKRTCLGQNRSGPKVLSSRKVVESSNVPHCEAVTNNALVASISKGSVLTTCKGSMVF